MEFFQETVQEQTQKIVKNFNIPQYYDRVENILKKSSFDFNTAFKLFPDRINEVLNRLENNFEDATVTLPTLDYLFFVRSFFNTYKELAQIINQFKWYIDSNTKTILSIGYPSYRFTKHKILNLSLATLYPVKFPVIIFGKETPDGKPLSMNEFRKYTKNMTYLFRWISNPSESINNTDVKPIPCKYENAPMINGFGQRDANKLYNLRQELLALKFFILDISMEYLLKGADPDKYWNECKEKINLNRDDFDYLVGIENNYRDPLLNTDLTGHIFIDRMSFCFGGSALHSGGIPDILGFISHVKTELSIGEMHKTKESLNNALQDQKFETAMNLLLHPKFDEIINAIKIHQKYRQQSMDCYKKFYSQIQTELKSKLKTPIYVLPEYKEKVAHIIDFIENGEEIGLSIDVSKSKQTQKIDTGQLWSEEKHRNIDRSLDEIKGIVRKAINKLYDTDKFLFERNNNKAVCERCLVFRFAHHLQNILLTGIKYKDFFVDCDFDSSFKYQRDGNGNIISEEKKGKSIKNEDGTEKSRLVDIIVHKRNYETHNDLFCLEIKKWNNYYRKDHEKDINNLKKLTSDYGYLYGFHLILGQKKQSIKWTLYKDGENIENNVIVFDAE